MKKTPATTTKRLSSPRQYRAVLRLLKGPCTVRELLDTAGGNGAPQLIAGLRRKGLKIVTTECVGHDRDGRPCRYGQYLLQPESRPGAEFLIEMYLAAG